ncbi:unnamed protein product [Rotaria sordida]|uniref:Uncharacterized protein n=1 Tax=Rotaria sordida TaxID=392033 RepID=A0A814CTM9_9BILA|nr:unnamed protein product [Rotaria sordida]
MATPPAIRVDMRKLTDCIYFINGNCRSEDIQCSFRHCRVAIQQQTECRNWPNSCRNEDCPYRHPGRVPDPPKPLLQKKHLVSFLWDIENVQIPRGQQPVDIVQRILQKFVVEPGLQLDEFSCFCKTEMMSRENLESLHHANVRIIHVADPRGPEAVDRQIMLGLDRFGRFHQPPATVVLISGDSDFIGKLSDLRYQAGFTVILIYKLAKPELKATVNAHYPWELFTEKRLPHSIRPASNDDTKKMACPHCTNTYATIEALRQHQKDKNHLFYCPVCNEGFPTSRSLDQHQNDKKHLFICPICNKSFPILQNLEQHQNDRKHLFYCQNCNEGFSTSSTLEQHQNDKKHLFYCPVCDRGFFISQDLEQHQNDEKHLLYCQNRDEGFFISQALEQHQNDMHNPDKFASNENKSNVQRLVAIFEQKNKCV